MSIMDVRKLTREQMFLFIDKIHDREEDKLKNEVHLHGGKWKSQGLDTDGAIPIEDIIESDKKLGKKSSM